MSGKRILSLDEFATAPRKPRADISGSLPDRNEAERQPGKKDLALRASEVGGEKNETSTGASNALRQMKRARMKGVNHFVNVKLDRDTKRRLKFAAFNTDTSMQAIMERAIRDYLDANSF